MSRSIWKNWHVERAILKVKQKKKSVHVWARNSSIPARFLRKTAFIHNGKEFKQFFITKEHLGLKFGELSFTRKRRKKKAETKQKEKSKKK